MSEAAGGKRREVRLPGREKAGRGKGRQGERKGKLRPARPGHRGNAGRREAKAAQLRTPGRGSRGPGRARQSAQGDAATGREGQTPPPAGGRPGGRDAPALLVPSDHSPPRSWGAPGNPAPSAPSVTPRPPLLTDPDPNPAERVARASRVVLRLRNLGSRPAYRSRSSYLGDSAARPAATAQAHGGNPASRKPSSNPSPKHVRLKSFPVILFAPSAPWLGFAPGRLLGVPTSSSLSRESAACLAAKEPPLLAWRSLIPCFLEVPKPTGFGGLRECLRHPMPPGMLGGVSYVQSRALALGPQPSQWVVSLGPQRSQEGINWTRPRRWMLPGIGVKLFRFYGFGFLKTGSHLLGQPETHFDSPCLQAPVPSVLTYLLITGSNCLPLWASVTSSGN